MKVLDLFSGIGGFSLGLERAGMTTIAFCEIEEYPRQVLKKHWPNVPIFEDVRKLKGEDVGTVDLICGGYPCQPFSLAGKRDGENDDRHLWPEMFRLLQETRAPWLIGENVAGHISMGLDEVLSDLESEGYESQTFVIPACAIDAPHRRDRVWIIAHSNQVSSRQGSSKQQQGTGLDCLRQRIVAHPQSERCRETRDDCTRSPLRPTRTSTTPTDVANSDSSCSHPGPKHSRRKTRRNPDQYGKETRPLANTNSNGLQERETIKARKRQTKQPTKRQAAAGGSQWPTEPPVGRVANGIPRRVDRLKCLGNAVVPHIPEMIGRAIMEAEGL